MWQLLNHSCPQALATNLAGKKVFLTRYIRSQNPPVELLEETQYKMVRMQLELRNKFKSRDLKKLQYKWPKEMVAFGNQNGTPTEGSASHILNMYAKGHGKWEYSCRFRWKTLKLSRGPFVLPGTNCPLCIHDSICIWLCCVSRSVWYLGHIRGTLELFL